MLRHEILKNNEVNSKLLPTAYMKKWNKCTKSKNAKALKIITKIKRLENSSSKPSKQLQTRIKKLNNQALSILRLRI